LKNLLLFLVLGNCGASAAARFWLVYQFHRQGVANGDKVKLAATTRRYAAVKNALPPYTVVGYLTDRPYVRYSRSVDEDPINVSELQDIQLVIAPLLLARNEDQQYLLGDFMNPIEGQKQIKQRNLSVITDYGQGVLLLRSGQ